MQDLPRINYNVHNEEYGVVYYLFSEAWINFKNNNFLNDEQFVELLPISLKSFQRLKKNNFYASKRIMKALFDANLLKEKF